MNRYELLRDGTTVYELDEDGVNRWSFGVQPGIGLDGYRQPASVIERVAKDVQVSMSYHHRLREALESIIVAAENIEGEHVIGRGDLDNKAESARALLKELEKTK